MQLGQRVTTSISTTTYTTTEAHPSRTAASCRIWSCLAYINRFPCLLFCPIRLVLLNFFWVPLVLRRRNPGVIGAPMKIFRNLVRSSPITWIFPSVQAPITRTTAAILASRVEIFIRHLNEWDGGKGVTEERGAGEEGDRRRRSEKLRYADVCFFEFLFMCVWVQVCVCVSVCVCVDGVGHVVCCWLWVCAQVVAATLRLRFGEHPQSDTRH